MKPDHRHELKTNELAEWLNNLPQWVKENSISIICVSAVIIGITTFYIWRIYNEREVARKQLELSSLISQLFDSQMQILKAQTQERDLSFILLQPADNLRIFARSIDDDQMAAFALIKQAEALRKELHFRQVIVPEQEVATQINQAKASYAEAIQRCSTNPSLTAMAKFGLGLCEEELGNFEAAEQIYRDITINPDFNGTVAAVQAKLRLETMVDYKPKIVFKPAPKKPAVELTRPPDTNLLTDANLDTLAANTLPEVPDANIAITPSSASETPDLSADRQDINLEVR